MTAVVSRDPTVSSILSFRLPFVAGWKPLAFLTLICPDRFMISIQTALEIKTVDQARWIGIFLRRVSLQFRLG